MSNSITQKMKYKQSVIKFSEKYGVYKAAIKFDEWPKTIYRWKKKIEDSRKIFFLTSFSSFFILKV